MNDLIILALLFDGPKHGYQLKREAGFMHGQGDMHNNLVYPMLRRFSSQGWVARKAVAGERGQTRQQYALTAKGRQELLRRLADFSEEDARSAPAFSARVGMFPLLNAENRTRILTRRASHLLHREQRLATVKSNMDLGTYGAEVVRFIEGQIRSELAWIERLRRMEKQESRREKSAAHTGR